MREIKILTPIGMLGYGFPREDYLRGLSYEPDAVITDSGSTDPGPYLLGTGQTLVKPMAYERDLRTILSGIGEKKIPFLIGSAGGAGTNENVEFITKMIRRICKELGLKKKIVKVYSDVDKALIMQRLREGRITSCSGAPELTEVDVESTIRVVGQMGAEPIVKALQENPDADIFVIGRCYDPSPYAAFSIYKGIKNPGVYWHMGKVMECGAFCAERKANVMLATIRDESFDLEPMEVTNRCTTVSVASHTLYEKTRPDLLPGPGGLLNLQTSQYEQITDRAVRVSGSTFIPSPQYQVKLEGGAIVGYRSAFIGGIRDPILIDQLDEFLENVRTFVGDNLYPEIRTGEAKIYFHVYGRDAVMGKSEPMKHIQPVEVGLLCEVVAKTQELADAICSNTRTKTLHMAYKGQLATGGNLALPLSPADNTIGPVSRFSIYHLMDVESPYELFPICVDEED